MKPIYLLLVLSAPCFGAIAITLPGTSESARWTGLNSTNHTSAEGFPGYFTTTNPWPFAIPGDAGATSGATFNKVSGGGYFATASLYDAGTPGTFHLADAAPLSGLASLVFQADIGSAFAGSPLLSINGSGTSIAPDSSATSTGNFSGGFSGPPEPTTNHAWQWDLSAAGAITSYEIVWSTAPHGTIYQLDLAAGDSFVQAIPEPATGVLGLAALGLTFIRRRRA